MPGIEQVHVFRKIHRNCAVMKDEPMLQYAVEELAALPLEYIEFYLPQLTHLVIHQPNDCGPVEQFLIRTSAVSAPIAIQLIWLFESCLGDLTGSNPAEKPIQDRCLAMIDKVKAASLRNAEEISKEIIREKKVRDNPSSPAIDECEQQENQETPVENEDDRVDEIVDGKADGTSGGDIDGEVAKEHDGSDHESSSIVQERMNRSMSEPFISASTPLMKRSMSMCSPQTKTEDSESDDEYGTRMKILCNKLIVFETISNQLSFIETLLKIGDKLVSIWPPERRDAALKSIIRNLTKSIPEGLFIPLSYSSDYCHTILNIIEDECRIFNSRTRAPYMLILEIRKHPDLNVADIASKKWLSQPPSATTKDPHEIPQEKVDFFNDKESAEEILTNVLQTSKRLSRLPSNFSIFGRSSLSALNDIRKTPYGELWCMKKQRLRDSSKFGKFPDWDVIPMIVKVGDDLRQEQLAAQMIGLLNQIFLDADLSIWLKPYRFIVTSANSGLVEVLTDCVSIHQLKKGISTSMSLGQYFEEAYRSQTDDKLRLAKRNFVESLAGYSIVCYLLQVKDRHNGNILIHLSGHVIHIDYGFILGMSPGGVNFEVAPFKFTKEYLEVMGGQESEYFSYFKLLFVQGLLEARKHMEDIILLAEMLLKDSKLPCLYGGDEVIHRLIERFQPDLNDENFIIYAQKLIYDSIHCWSTTHYDSFQYLTNGIY